MYVRGYLTAIENAKISVFVFLVARNKLGMVWVLYLAVSKQEGRAPVAVELQCTTTHEWVK
jgi:hypothetical protein